MWVFLCTEIKTVEFSRNCIPEAGSSQGIVGVHLVLKADFIVVYLFEIVYDFNIALD